MRLRGFGDLLGFKQSGIKNFKLADPVHNEDLFLLAEQQIKKIEKENINIKRYKPLLKLYDQADIINDISAGVIDNSMLKTIAKLNVPYIAMHMQGRPNNMQHNPKYKSVVDDILIYFKNKITEIRSYGIENIIIDPGFGFGKTIDHNYEILNNLDRFQEFNLPILAGISRKSMIYNVLDTSSKDALNGTIAANTIAISKGAKILRVHDVKEAIECIKIVNFVNK